MSGHSKWAQIKRSKGAKDAKRGILFSRLSKKITLAAKAGGTSDSTLNFQLRTEIENAKAQGMPNENIERAAKKAFEKGAAEIKQALYEGYGPYGTAFLVESATDNTNRAVQTIKHSFSKAGGSLGAMGSVSWQFASRGQILIERSEDMESIQMIAIEAGAEDVVESAEGLEVYTRPDDLERIKDYLEKSGAKIVGAEIIKSSSQLIVLEEEEQVKVQALIDELEDNEDVVAVHTNAIL